MSENDTVRSDQVVATIHLPITNVDEAKEIGSYRIHDPVKFEQVYQTKDTMSKTGAVRNLSLGSRSGRRLVRREWTNLTSRNDISTDTSTVEQTFLKLKVPTLRTQNYDAGFEWPSVLQKAVGQSASTGRQYHERAKGQTDEVMDKDSSAVMHIRTDASTTRLQKKFVIDGPLLGPSDAANVLDQYL